MTVSVDQTHFTSLVPLKLSRGESLPVEARGGGRRLAGCALFALNMLFPGSMGSAKVAMSRELRDLVVLRESMKTEQLVLGATSESSAHAKCLWECVSSAMGI